MIELFLKIQQGSVLQYKISPQIDFNNWFWLCTCPRTSFHCNTRPWGFHYMLMQLRTEFFHSSSGREKHSSPQHLNVLMWNRIGEFQASFSSLNTCSTSLGCSSEISKTLDFLDHFRNLCVCFLLSKSFIPCCCCSMPPVFCFYLHWTALDASLL